MHTAADHNIIATTVGMMFLYFTLLVAGFITWVISLIDVVKSEFNDGNNKTIWLIILFVIPPIGAILYQLIGKHQKKKTKENIVYSQSSIITKKKDMEDGKWY